MQDKDDRILQLIEENRRLRDRLDVTLNTIMLLQETIQQLRDEIAVLKGQKPRPKIPPSTLEGSGSGGQGGGNGKGDNPTRGKHPRLKKTHQLPIHNKNRIQPEGLPKEAIFKGCQKYTVQDIILQPHNTVYELERWQLPDGTYLTGQLPQNIHGHYGPQLVTYILHQYHGCRVTEPLLLIQLREIGVLISAGQLSNILTENKEAFHQEKNDLLPAGVATGDIKTDDTGARHQGQNGYSTILGNEYFTYIVTTESKSRINFLSILHGVNPQYLINQDTADYIETLKPSSCLGGYLLLHAKDRSMNQKEWKKFLLELNIQRESEIKLATEAALL